MEWNGIYLGSAAFSYSFIVALNTAGKEYF